MLQVERSLLLTFVVQLFGIKNKKFHHNGFSFNLFLFLRALLFMFSYYK